MKQFKFNDFDKYIKKDRLYLILYLVMLAICLAIMGLNIAVIVMDPQNYASIAFLAIFALITVFDLYLIVQFLLVDKKLVTINFKKETITINKRIVRTIEVPLTDITQTKIIKEKMFFNVLNLGSLYLITKDKTYRIKYLISPMYLEKVLNVYLSVIKDEELNGK